VKEEKEASSTEVKPKEEAMEVEGEEKKEGGEEEKKSDEATSSEVKKEEDAKEDGKDKVSIVDLFSTFTGCGDSTFRSRVELYSIM
jgi:hypothetical protein